MRTTVLVALTVVALGCNGRTPVPIAEPNALQQRKAEEITYVDLRPESILKRFPSEPDPATNAEDPESCRKAGGEWSDVYYLGVLILREPQDGAERAGKGCWPTRQPTRFADAGKPCNGQADCIGNCMSVGEENGKWSPPRCQIHAEESVCGALYDSDQYHRFSCPVP